MFENIEFKKEFNSLEECNAWEEENFPNREYKGRTILCIAHTEKAWNGHVTLDSITII